jgi:hypothetical protein
MVNDWSRGIVRVPMGDDHELSVDYDCVGGKYANSTERYAILDAGGEVGLPPFGQNDYGFDLVKFSEQGRKGFIVRGFQRITRSGERSDSIRVKVWLNGNVLTRYVLPQPQGEGSSGLKITLPLEYRLSVVAPESAQLEADGSIVTFFTPDFVIRPGQMAKVTGTKGAGYNIVMVTA